jgi:MFS family permease
VSQTTLTPRERLLARLPLNVHDLLTPALRRLLLGTLIGFLGMGLQFSLFVLYCHDIRGFTDIIAGWMLVLEALLGIALSPLYGTLVDRFGPSPVLAVAMPVSAIGVIAIGFTTTVPLMFVVISIFSVGGAGMWSAFSVLITRIVREEHRQDAFGINFMLMNVGIGIGSLVGTQIANLHDAGSFQLLYTMSGALMLVYAAIMFTLRRHGGRLETPVHQDLAEEGWVKVLKDRRMVRLVLSSLVVMVCGYGSIEAGMPLFVTQVAKLSIHWVGLLFFFNTFTIIVVQLFVLSGIKGRSRSLLMGLVGLLWGASWLLATSSLLVGAIGTVAILCVGQIVFAIGEAIWQPVSPALVNDLSPEHLRGRYNAFIGIVWAGSSAIGQLVATVFIQYGRGRLWTLCLAGGAILGGLGLTTMRSVLTPLEDGRVLPEPA